MTADRAGSSNDIIRKVLYSGDDVYRVGRRRCVVIGNIDRLNTYSGTYC